MPDQPDDVRIRNHPVFGNLTASDDATISLDGQQLRAIEGQSIAAALLANGYRAVRTMPSGGAPRGQFCGIGRCPDCMMVVDGQLNVRACVTRVRHGMVLETQVGHGFRAEQS